MEESIHDQLKSTEVNTSRPRKIVSSFKDVLKLNEDDLQDVLSECIKGLPNPEQHELPVAILSIVGPPSCGKSFLTNLVINYYNSEEDDGGWLEKLTKKSKERTHPRFTGFAWHSVTNPPSGIFKPNDEEISTSGVYMWPQLFTRSSNERGKSILVLILHLCLGRDKTDDDLQTLERFLVMTSSRMAEIDYGNKDFRMLNEVLTMKSAINQLPTSCLSEQHCNSLVYILSSHGASSSFKLSAGEEAKEELLQIGQDPAGNKIKDQSLTHFTHVNLARIKHIKGTLEESLLKVEKNMTRSLKKITGKITDESEVAPKKVKENGATRNLHLADIVNLFKATVDEVNAVSSHLPPNKRKAVDYSNFHIPPESSPSPLSPSDNSVVGTSGEPENLEPSMDSSRQTKPCVSPPPNEEQAKCLIQPPKLDVFDVSSIRHQTVEVDITPEDDQQEITPTSSIEIARGTIVNDAKPQDTFKKIVNKATVNEVNAVSSVKSSPLALPPLDNSNYGSSGDSENVEPLIDSSPQTKPFVSPPPTEKETKCLIQSPKLDVCDIGPNQHQTVEVNTTPKDHQQEITPTLVIAHETIVASITRNDETSAKLNNARPQETFKKNLNNEQSCPDSSSNLMQGTVGTDKPASVAVNNVETKQTKNEDEKHKPNEALDNIKMDTVEQDSEGIKKIANEHVEELKSLLFYETELWLGHHLSHSNISEISNIYDNAFQLVMERAEGSFEGTSSEELNGLMDKECRASYQVILESVESRIKRFYTSMKRQFELLDCFTKEELTEVGKIECSKVTSGMSTDNSQVPQLVRLGCENLMGYFQAQNTEIINNEAALADQLSIEAKDFYNEEMRLILLKEIYPPARLLQIHTELTDKLLHSLRMAFKLISRESICHTVEEKLEALREALITEFGQHLQENKTKLNKKHKQITAIQRESESSYKENIDKLITHSPAGIQPSSLESYHKVIVKQYKELFKTKIQEKMNNPNEPCEAHLKSLQAYIDQHWRQVCEINDQNLLKTVQQRKKKKDEERRQAEEIRRAEMANEQEQLWAEIRAQNAAVGQHCSRKTTPSSSKSTNVDIPQLPPLIVQILSSRIKMGILVNGKLQILPNAFGQLSTPFVAGMSASGQLIYGDEVCTSEPSHPLNVKKSWRVMKLLLGSESAQKMRVRLNDGNTHTVTVEFLLGFIFNNLKRHVESKINGAFRTVIITIPFWLTSTQRIRVRNGAELAGFSEVYLINEASAAAYACASSELRLSSANNILVLSENADMITAFVYSYDIGATKVQMTGHHGSYLDDGIWNLLKGTAYQLCKGTEAEKVKRLKQICTEALSQAGIHKYSPSGYKEKPKEVLVFSESVDWMPILENVGKDFAKKVCDPDHENVVILGAAILSKEPSKIKSKIRDQLAFGFYRQYYDYYDSFVVSLLMRNALLPVNPWKFSINFPVGNNEFQQQENGKIMSVGSFSLPFTWFWANSLVEVYLSIDNEAIIRIHDAKLIIPGSSSRMYLDYNLTIPNLSHNELSRLRSLLDNLTHPKLETNELSKARQELRDLCSEMTHQLRGGMVTCEDQKNCIAEVIEDVQNTVENTDCTYEDIQNQLVKLVKLQSTFMK